MPGSVLPDWWIRKQSVAVLPLRPVEILEQGNPWEPTACEQHRSRVQPTGRESSSLVQLKTVTKFTSKFSRGIYISPMIVIFFGFHLY